MTTRMDDLLSEEIAKIGYMKQKDGEIAINWVVRLLMDGVMDGVYEFAGEDTA